MTIEQTLKELLSVGILELYMINGDFHAKYGIPSEREVLRINDESLAKLLSKLSSCVKEWKEGR